jgi:phosphoribosyl 1,2-cyclic phosphodiesterase
MGLQITSLNSGSNGNCYYVGNSTEAVLVDVGISCREVEKRMKQVGLLMGKVKAIFISHEHGDHIKGVTTLANKYNLPVYITELTAKHGPRLIGHLTQKFIAHQPVKIGELSVTAFSKKHDAIDPHSFIICYNKITVGVFTDIGVVCSNTIQYFKQCHAIFLEANYDEAMLENGKYPQHLKNRISGDEGHLSNKQALDLCMQHKPIFMSHIILSHLSKENNSPDVALQLFEQNTKNIKISVAPRHEALKVFTIGDYNISNKLNKSIQLGLFA